MYNARSSHTPLDDVALNRLAPSIFATSQHAGCSDQYQFLPTIEVVNLMRQEGWSPVHASEQSVRDEAREGYQRHTIRFRHQGLTHAFDNIGDSVPEILITNSHDRSAAYQVHAALFRLVCLNGLVVGDGTFNHVSIVHKNFDPKDVIEASYTVIDEVPQIAAQVDAMQTTHLTREEQEVFAEAAIGLRWDEKAHKPIPAADLLQHRRSRDAETDLWSTYNRIQENLLRGGLRGRNAAGRRSRTRAIKGVHEDLRLNKALWSLAEKMKELKAN